MKNRLVVIPMAVAGVLACEAGFPTDTQLEPPLLGDGGGGGTPPVSAVSIQAIFPVGIDPDEPVAAVDEFVAFLATLTGGCCVLTIVWDFGDGTVIEDGTLIGHTYTTPGTYNVSVDVTDADSETGEILGAATGNITLLVEAVAIQVTIDIKPGSDPNSVNLGSNGGVPVAIFSTDQFDATTVDPATVTLADAAVRVVGRGNLLAAPEDVNGDGLLDLVVHVDTDGLNLTDGDTEAVLTGQTFDGTEIWGTDSIRVVP